MRYLALVALFCTSPAMAGPPVIEAARATLSGDTWSVHVTLRHADTGWDHYADGWSVQTPDGTQIGYRTLHHPHVTEQPFTRSLGGLVLPDGDIQIVPHDSVHGWGAPFIVQR